MGTFFTEESVRRYLNITLIPYSHYDLSEDDSNSVRTAKLSITDGMNVTPIFVQLTTQLLLLISSVISADANHVIYFEKIQVYVN